MNPALRDKVKSALLLVGYGNPEKAVAAVQQALKLRPLALSVKKTLWLAKDEIKRGALDKAVALLNGVLTDSARMNGEHNTYARPVTATTLPVIYYSMRGGLRLKPEGGIVRLNYDPGKPQPQHILFLKSGNPVAIALCYRIEKSDGDWSVNYSNVQWLHDEEKNQ